LYVWGNNKSGTTTIHALGIGNLTGGSANHNMPRLNTNLDNVGYVATGGNSSFAADRSGQLWAWGANGDGQLGLDTFSTPKSVSKKLEYPETFSWFGLWWDDDNDTLPDPWETYYFGPLGLSFGPNDDPDGDGLTNFEEWERRLNPTRIDSDGDLFDDAYELSHPQFTASVPDPLHADYDGDGLSNILEIVYRTDPTKSDSDNDGVDDNAEVIVGADPNNGDDGGVGSPEGVIVLRLTVGDPSGSESE